MTDNQKQLLEDDDFMMHLRQLIFHFKRLQQVEGSELTPEELIQHERILIEDDIDFDYIRQELGEVYEIAWRDVSELGYPTKVLDALNVTPEEEYEKITELYRRFQRKYFFK